jgi:hypothetical protein
MYWHIGYIWVLNAHLAAQIVGKGGVALIWLWLINKSPPHHQESLSVGNVSPHHHPKVYILGLHVGKGGPSPAKHK